MVNECLRGQNENSRVWHDAHSGKAFQYYEIGARSLYFARLRFRSGLFHHVSPHLANLLCARRLCDGNVSRQNRYM